MSDTAKQIIPELRRPSAPDSVTVRLPAGFTPERIAEMLQTFDAALGALVIAENIYNFAKEHNWMVPEQGWEHLRKALGIPAPKKNLIVVARSIPKIFKRHK